ncbi:MAG TPA: hypothetical protein VFW65_35450 [Pseudonocardiaceae bacterium]|nr:hypothetical protein [Pseudonocardiaceae bacterium]
MSGSPAGFDGFARVVAEAIPLVVARIPSTPAATLGRLAVAEGRPRPRPAGNRLHAALLSLGPLLAERLLGALELHLDGIMPALPDGIVDHLERPGTVRVAVAWGSQDSETARAVTILEAQLPGVCDLLLDLTNTLRQHEIIAPLLVVTGRDEPEFVARHGAVHLGLAVVVAGAVTQDLRPPAPAVVGAGLGAAAAILPDLPMPPGYAEAVLVRQREQYRYPQSSSVIATVRTPR